MGCRLPYWVALCLLGAVSMDPGVIQTPKHLVTGTTRSVTLKCKQHLGHNAMYWYKQSVQKPPKLMLAYNYKNLFENATASSRFLPDRSNNSQLDLQIKALEPEDSALYLCASSKGTALHLQLLPVHKPPGSKPGSCGGHQRSAQHFLEDPRDPRASCCL
uniref:Ig-like domain-containing protein n=1 Tax=Mustela putorius furo TaxID=9669 RepID=M3YB04_MUSPF